MEPLQDVPLLELRKTDTTSGALVASRTLIVAYTLSWVVELAPAVKPLVVAVSGMSAEGWPLPSARSCTVDGFGDGEPATDTPVILGLGRPAMSCAPGARSELCCDTSWSPT